MLTKLQSMFQQTDTIARDARLNELRYVVFDTEFTSLDAKSNRLLSIGAVVMDGTKIRVGEQFYRATNPDVEVPGESVVVHRLTPDDVARGEDPKAVVLDFLQFIEGAVLVGHFVQHDLDIVGKELRRAGSAQGLARRAHVDTSLVYRGSELHRTHYPAEAFDERTINVDLASVAAHYGITFDEAHHALADAFVTAQVWQKQLAVLAARGVHSWRHLRKMAR